MKVLVLLLASAMSLAAATAANAQYRYRFGFAPPPHYYYVPHRMYGPMPGSTRMYVRPMPQPMPRTYIYAPVPQVHYSTPSWMFYHGVSPGYAIGSRINGPSRLGAIIQAGRAAILPGRACAMTIDAQGHWHC